MFELKDNVKKRVDFNAHGGQYVTFLRGEQPASEGETA